MNTGEFAVVRKLVMADVRRRPGRLLLTILSTIAAACIVVWVVSGYDSLVQSFRELAEKYLGRYELVILPVGPGDSPLPPLVQRSGWLAPTRPGRRRGGPRVSNPREDQDQEPRQASQFRPGGRLDLPATLPHPPETSRRLLARMPPSHPIHWFKGSGSIPRIPSVPKRPSARVWRKSWALRLETT